MATLNSVFTVQPFSQTPSTSPLRNRLAKLLLLTPVLMGERSLGKAESQLNLRGPSLDRRLNSNSMTDRSASNPEGKLDCPCIPINATSLTHSERYDPDNGCLYFREPGQTFCYPANYGFDGCQAYDKGLPPSCNQEGFPGNPDWCTKSFCYVDPNNCKNTDNFPSTYFKEEGLHYSYKTCGSQNTFIGMVNDQLDASFMELAAVLERFVVGFRFTLEKGYQNIKDFSNNPNSVAKECSYTDSCDPVLEGSFNACWDETIDFNNANVVFHPERVNQAIPSDVNTLACLSHSVKATFLNVAELEHDDSNRIGYIYYGDQATGGLVLYPEQPFCSNSFDARFRPWYASAVSGPKDVVVVIDTSGSMRGNRIELAKQATDAVLDTLTWADRISLVTFNDTPRAYSTSLLASNEENVIAMKEWIQESFTASGQTNFMDSLQMAYDLLDNNKDANDQKSCSQAILFLTDGQAVFDSEKMQGMIDHNPNAVVFSYGLSSDAQEDALQQMACMTNGIYYPVRNEAELPRMMSSYYEYYAKLQDNGKLSWLKYQDAVTGEEIVSGCTPIFNYDQSGLIEPDLVGVTCMDLNIIIGLDSLKTCDNNAFNHFIEQIFREATRCSSPKGKVEDQCVLQNMRARIHRDSICEGGIKPGTCSVEPQATATDFSNLNPARFEVIPLDGCTIQESSCATPPFESTDNPDDDTPPDETDPGSNSSSMTIIIGAAAAGAALMTAAGVCLWYRRGSPSEEEQQQPSSANYNTHNAPTVQAELVEEEFDVIPLPPPTNPELNTQRYGSRPSHWATPSAPTAPAEPVNHKYY